jgi:hypothetical protein
VQERLTTQVARWLCDALEPRGVGVVIEAEHLCMSLAACRSPALGPSRLRCTAWCATIRGLARSSSP